MYSNINKIEDTLESIVISINITVEWQEYMYTTIKNINSTCMSVRILTFSFNMKKMQVEESNANISREIYLVK